MARALVIHTMSRFASLLVNLSLGALCALSVACSGTDEKPAMANMTPGTTNMNGFVQVTDDQLAALNFGEASGVCEMGKTRRCSIKLQSQNGVHNCYVGEQACEAGQWGACSDPTSP